MKKLFWAVLAFVFMLPTIVKADMGPMQLYHNDTVTVGEIYEANFVMGYGASPFENFTIEYDSNYLSIDKDHVAVVFEGSNILKEGEGTVEISNGKITINIVELPEGRKEIDWDLAVESTAYYVEVQFTALKAGTTTVTADLPLTYFAKPAVVNIKENSNKEANDKNETNKDTAKEEEKKCSSNDLALYISLGANGLLFILLIISLLTRNNKKTIAE